MGDKKASIVSEIETRDVTVTVTGRLTRKQADMVVDAINQVSEQVAKHLGIDLSVDASAPPETAKGEPDPAERGKPCKCARCTLLRELGAVLGIEPPTASTAPDSKPEPAINAIPERGPWGAS